MSEQKIKQQRTRRRKKRVSIKMIGTKTRPRVSVYRSNQHMFIQVIDDGAHATVASASDIGKKDIKGTKTARATVIGQQLAQVLKKIGVKQVVFDRGSYRYLGRVSALAQSMRDEGITI